MALGMDGAHNQSQHDQFMWMEDMMYDALRQQESFQVPNVDNMETPPNKETQRFYKLLLDENMPLYEGASKSRLSMCVKLLSYKSSWNVPD